MDFGQMGEAADIQDSPLQDLTPVGSHPNMHLYTPVPRGLPVYSSYPRNVVPQMPQYPGLHPDFQMSFHAPMETGFQIPQEPERSQYIQISESAQVPQEMPMQSGFQWKPEHEEYLGPQVFPGLSMKPTPPRHLGPITYSSLAAPMAYPVDLSLQMPSHSLVNSGSQGTSGPLVSSGEYRNQRICPKAPKTRGNKRLVYSAEQRLILEKFYKQNKYPNPDQLVELALKVGVTTYQIQIWFKNKRSKDKGKNLKNIHKGQPQIQERSREVAGSTSSPGGLTAEASAEGDFAYVGSLPQQSPSLGVSLHDDQTGENTDSSFQEDLLDRKGPAAPPDSSQLEALEASTDSAIAESPASGETSVPAATTAYVPEDAQNSDSFSDELWDIDIEVLLQFED